MTITNQTILSKMDSELQKAVANKSDADSVRKHVHAVRMLCDLILDTDPHEIKESQSKTHELNKMMGDLDTSQTVSVPKQRTTPRIDHGEANGDSIFDF